MEFGVGIHGEPGIDRRPFSSLDQTVDEMFDTLLVNGSYHRTLRFWDYQQAVGRKNNKPNNRSSLAIG
ncbi:PTS-dependent dihydroxyacetone kinase, dihydroxyacetone-binding subunit [Escherichia coli]|nr:PTS-dependent dihydroxyacetone kinase, dihydroxyacetone-binding subunit [Escherichia coli]